ncbi:thioredoxin family protein, partial [Ameyamaea chiangmaiensis]
LAAWLFGLGQRAAMRDGARGRVRTLRAAALGLVLGVISLLPGLEHRAAAEQSPGSGMATTATTTPFTEARLASLRASGQPVFIDMTAAWCITCLVNERVALSAPSVRAAFDAAHVAVLRGDWTNRDAALGAFLQAHGRDGVPLYVFYPPHGEAQILPQILTPGIVLDALKG